jgi:hypothetical protein
MVMMSLDDGDDEPCFKYRGSTFCNSP